MKIIILKILKTIGFFRLSKIFFRKKLLILAYHGFELEDETEFDNKLFIKPSTLDNRMRWARDNGFNFITLDTAVRFLLDKKPFPPHSLVVTVDDGWYSTAACGDEIFSKYTVPYTVYITSYFSDRKLPVLNIVLRYLIWRWGKANVESKGIDIGANEECLLQETLSPDELKKRVLSEFSSLKNTAERELYVRKIAVQLQLDYDDITVNRKFSLLNCHEIGEISRKNVDIQLHTHRHHLPLDDPPKFQNELFENKDYLIGCATNAMNHFCYPSGVFDSNCADKLAAAGVVSATTCKTGFVSNESDRYYLPRFLDGENIPQIVFEAELSGVNEILRRIRNKIR